MCNGECQYLGEKVVEGVVLTVAVQEKLANDLCARKRESEGESEGYEEMCCLCVCVYVCVRS